MKKTKAKIGGTAMDGKLTRKKSSLLKDAGGNRGGVVVDLETGRYYSVNNAGKEILSAINGKKTGFDIAKIMARRYKISQPAAERDVKKFISGLKGAGLVR